MKIKLRDLEVKDLDDYEYWNHPSREFHSFNGPYFRRETESELKERIEILRNNLLKGEESVLEKNKLIVNLDTDEIIGEVNWYWKSEETFWMEVGIVIFNDKYWGIGIGYNALKKWINEIFSNNPKLVRVGLTTWSGNISMIKLAEKLSLNKEAVYKKARIVDGEYYDSVSYGILRENWKYKE